MALSYVIGVDCGGSKSVALAVNERGELVRQARAGGLNPVLDKAAAVRERLCELLEPLGVRQAAPAAVCLGISGGGREEERRVVERVVRDFVVDAKLEIVHDAEIALRAAAPGGVGVAVVAGTGSIGFGRDAAGRTVRCGGWGHAVGDEGSATWIVREALRRAFRGKDGLDPSTQLLPALEAAVDARDSDGLMRWVYADTVSRERFANLLSVVDRVARAGDAVALELLQEAGVALASLGALTARRLGMQDDFVLALAGGAFLGSPILASETRKQLQARAGTVGAKTLFLEREPAWGAVELAMRNIEAD